MRSFVINSSGYLYRRAVRPFLFRGDPETVHLKTTALGERLGNSPFAKRTLASLFAIRNPSLAQRIFGIDFANPIGLAAGFDYEGRLTRVLPAMGFGFGTVGTLTYRPYQGNPRPMLGRLPRSRSLMVNKGFKNLGVEATLSRLAEATLHYPVGVSIGKTNTLDHKTQAEAVADIVNGFRAAERSNAAFAYYELNVSCPNLSGSIEFYEPRHLEELLLALAELGLARPVFVKMPISKTDGEIRGMMDVIVRFPFVKAVILGNLQRDRMDPAMIPEEAALFPVGSFSGIPCQKRSDELIRLAYAEYGSKLKIIGCGGTFSADDAYRKIRLGASLVQLITGLIYEGPQLVVQINRDLGRFLQRDGYRSIAEAVGVDAS